MSKITTIKGALINCLIGKKVVEDSFQGLVLEAHRLYKADFEAACKSAEKEVKSEFGITATPATYRTKKRLIIGCKEAGISLYDGAIPKTEDELKAELNEHKGTIAAVTPEVEMEIDVTDEVPPISSDYTKPIAELCWKWADQHMYPEVAITALIEKLKEEHAKRFGC